VADRVTDTPETVGDPSWVPLRVAGRPRGRIIAPVAAALRHMPRLFLVDGPGFSLRDAEFDSGARSSLLQNAALQLRAAGLVPGWRDEACELLDANGSELARFERAAFRALGLRNRAVHINGCLPDGRLWIARRSPRKTTAPNKLDNMAAGAISAGETPQQCAQRELWEEAGVPARLAAHTRFTGGSVSSLRPLAHGFHDELVLCADLLLPDDFRPVCQDGEVAEFICMSRPQILEALARDEFSVEAELVVRDWLERQATGAGSDSKAT